MVSVGVWVIGMVRLSVPVAPWPVVAVTVLATLPPASSSAWVTVWTAVQVVLSVGARVVAGQTGGGVGVGVGEGQAGQGHVAGVGDEVAVRDDLAGRR